MNRFQKLSAAALVAACLAPAAHADDKLTIGIVTFSTSDVDTNQMVDTMTKEAQSKGWTVETLNANGDPSQAITSIKQLATKKVNAIIVTVFDSTGLAAGLQAAADAKIPVLSAGGGMADGIALSASTGAAPPLIELMLKDVGDTGTLLDLTYHPGIPCRERADAFDAAVKAKPGLKATSHEISIPGAAESSQAATSAWLAANANAKGPFAIFNCYDDNAMGAIAALKQNGRSDVKVYSFNATAPAVQAVKDGTMTATLGVDLTSAGKMLVDQIPDILAAGDKWQPKSFVPGYTLVTKDNVDQFMKDNPQ
ncbi:sugar ABC transporter substrate-binding protein [Mesorhizobium amorphae]|uniref:Sugar ABC transporter periplasmic component n=1 Tax=Mesorhizobium amorphae CCNWGS0123 TaxID=1082933 RepID=G6Y809_9HYPH|nr:sugar ABC transporter substrate-binding protein [Mesorhizobium amorphae]ANT50885.1 sugar ABC transporter substrate-binding protein [Mesorhizobium amorphae CCNWGS0123]EHH12243.1 sugar ABC transporter periplasmic component [Mesorhizobium amorphae CCNWGS0123]GLR42960.1 sugar ABC transporter substrate-binding protein [Mesorhizobium amorphae]